MEKPRVNRLAKESSAYLRSAAHQPVDWHPWGEEAFKLAREQDKPILLDIGAVWCHWCHVMDGESYENEEVARIINERFVPIKVDRDERPDIDRRYQNAVGAITGQGGWPLTAFLTHEAKVFYGGTYFPPQDMHGRPGFTTLLLRLSEIYQKDKVKALENAESVHVALEKGEALGRSLEELRPEMVTAALEAMGRSFDIANGGFDSAPKFPHSGAIELILRRYYETHQDWLMTIATKTLEKMARGGMYDQIGGGFHRYSVDEKWIVPHFEKMSYDNSEHLKNYLHAYQATGDEFFKEIALGIINYVNTVASDQEHGGFYASQDADISLHDDGDYFTWTLKEVEEVLSPEEARVVALHYNVYQQGEMHHNPAKNVLFVDMEPEAIAQKLSMSLEEVKTLLEKGKQRLLEVRSQRPVPFVDKTLYSNWNGMMLSAYLEAYKVLGLESCRDFAIKSLELLLANSYSPQNGFFHSFFDGQAKITGILDDQVQMAQALLDAYEVTAQRRYLEIAESIAHHLLESYWDEEEGGFFDIAKIRSADPGLSTKDKPIQDSPTPASNSVAAIVLDTLYYLTDKSIYRQRAEELLKAFGEGCSRLGIYAATYFLALDYHLSSPAHAVIVGKREDQLTLALHKAALTAYRPKKLVSMYEPDGAHEDRLPSVVASMLERSDKPLVYVCAGFACAPPIDNEVELEATLKSFGLSDN